MIKYQGMSSSELETLGLYVQIAEKETKAFQNVLSNIEAKVKEVVDAGSITPTQVEDINTLSLSLVGPMKEMILARSKQEKKSFPNLKHKWINELRLQLSKRLAPLISGNFTYTDASGASREYKHDRHYSFIENLVRFQVEEELNSASPTLENLQPYYFALERDQAQSNSAVFFSELQNIRSKYSGIETLSRPTEIEISDEEIKDLAQILHMQSGGKLLPWVNADVLNNLMKDVSVFQGDSNALQPTQLKKTFVDHLTKIMIDLDSFVDGLQKNSNREQFLLKWGLPAFAKNPDKIKEIEMFISKIIDINNKIGTAEEIDPIFQGLKLHIDYYSIDGRPLIEYLATAEELAKSDFAGIPADDLRDKFYKLELLSSNLAAEIKWINESTDPYYKDEANKQKAIDYIQSKITLLSPLLAKLKLAQAGILEEEQRRLQEQAARMVQEARERRAQRKEVRDPLLFKYQSPELNNVNATANEWKRLWQLAEDKHLFWHFIEHEILPDFEREYAAYSETHSFLETSSGKKYQGLIQFFHMELQENERSEESEYFHAYFENRLSLADKVYTHGVSGSAYVDFYAAIVGSFPAYARHTIEFFTAASTPKEGEHRYEFARVVRAMDLLMTSYYDELPPNFVQQQDDEGNYMFYQGGKLVSGPPTDIFVTRNESGESVIRPDGDPVAGVYREIYVIRDNTGAVIAQVQGDLRKEIAANKAMFMGGDRQQIQAEKDAYNIDLISKQFAIDHPELTDFTVKRKYSDIYHDTPDGEMKREQSVPKAHFSFARARWVNAYSGFKQRMFTRLEEDFACLPGVRTVLDPRSGEFSHYEVNTYNRVIKNGKKVDEPVRLKIDKQKIAQIIEISFEHNSALASRAEVFASLYYAVGKSPNDDPNIYSIMMESYPLAKELNLAKEVNTVVEIPYIVSGGDISDDWLLQSAVQIGLLAHVFFSRNTGLPFRSQPNTPERASEIAERKKQEEDRQKVFGKHLRKMADQLNKRVNDLSQEDFFAYAPKHKDLPEEPWLLRIIRESNQGDVEGNSDINRFRAILRAIHVSRLKRDFLGLNFVTNKTSNEIYSSVSGAANFDNEPVKHLAAVVDTPRTQVATYKQNDLYLNQPQHDINIGPRHRLDSEFKSMHETAQEVWKKISEGLPEMTGNKKKDINLIVADFNSMLNLTSKLKKNETMFNWRLFVDFVQMRLTSLIFRYRKKYEGVFDQTRRNTYDVLTFKPSELTTLINKLRDALESSGQVYVGKKTFGDSGALIKLLKAIIPGKENNSIFSLRYFKNIINNILLGKPEEGSVSAAFAGLYGGGMSQRVPILVNTSEYARALRRYNALINLGESGEGTFLTEENILNQSSTQATEAKKAQDSEKESQPKKH